MLDDNRARGDALLAVSEARLPKEPWELAAMEPTKRETMLAAIRVIDIVIDEVEGQSKLNQHKLVARRRGSVAQPAARFRDAGLR